LSKAGHRHLTPLEVGHSHGQNFLHLAKHVLDALTLHTKPNQSQLNRLQFKRAFAQG